MAEVLNKRSTPWRPTGKILGLALVGLVAPRFVAETLAAHDHSHSLERNQQLRESTDERREEAFQELVLVTARRLRLLRRQLLTSFAWLGSSILVAWVVGLLWHPSNADFKLLAILAVFVFAWATLGRLGWAGQSIKGNTAPERLDLRLFWCLYWVGMFMTTLAIQ